MKQLNEADFVLHQNFHTKIFVEKLFNKILTINGTSAQRIRIAKPGPGNGWRLTIASGNPRVRPSSRTSSLWKSCKCSTTFP